MNDVLKPPGYRSGTEACGPHHGVHLRREEFESLSAKYGREAIRAKIIYLDNKIKEGIIHYVEIKNHSSIINYWCGNDDKPQRPKPTQTSARPRPNEFRADGAAVEAYDRAMVSKGMTKLYFTNPDGKRVFCYRRTEE